jgi:hypothetical protein
MREEFCTAVKILLQRMETHPEEFHKPLSPALSDGKWTNLMSQIAAIKHGEKIRGDVTFMTDHVMREVLTPEEDEGVERTVTFKAKNRYNPPAEGLIGTTVNSVITDAFVYGSVAEAEAARLTMLQQIQARQQARQQALRGNNPTTMHIDEVYDPLTAGIK